MSGYKGGDASSGVQALLCYEVVREFANRHAENHPNDAEESLDVAVLVGDLVAWYGWKRLLQALGAHARGLADAPKLRLTGAERRALRNYGRTLTRVGERGGDGWVVPQRSPRNRKP